LMNDERFRDIPKILETPKGKEMKEDIENMKVLRRLVKKHVGGPRVESGGLHA